LSVRRTGGWSWYLWEGKADTGFHLPDGALLSPDASWIQRERWESLAREEREGFVPLCPDAVFEVRSAAQNRRELQDKMHAYVRNGARIAVLVDPYRRAVEVYRPGRDYEVYEDPEGVRLDPDLPGFELDLRPVFER
jgi:Uma2 family endonuclease